MKADTDRKALIAVVRNRTRSKLSCTRRQRFAFVLIWSVCAIMCASGQQQQGKISGIVCDQNGAAITNATVEFDTNGNTTRTTTDETGNFTVLSTRTYGTLSISSPGFSSVQIKVTATDDPLRIQLHPAGVMERIVVNAPVDYDHTPVSQFNLGRHEIDSSGALTIDDVLRQVPGFSLFRRSGGLTTNPTAQGVS